MPFTLTFLIDARLLIARLHKETKKRNSIHQVCACLWVACGYSLHGHHVNLPKHCTANVSDLPLPSSLGPSLTEQNNYSISQSLLKSALGEIMENAPRKLMRRQRNKGRGQFDELPPIDPALLPLGSNGNIIPQT